MYHVCVLNTSLFVLADLALCEILSIILEEMKSLVYKEVTKEVNLKTRKLDN
jgi:hypothetical protein